MMRYCSPGRYSNRGRRRLYARQLAVGKWRQLELLPLWAHRIACTATVPYVPSLMSFFLLVATERSNIPITCFSMCSVSIPRLRRGCR